MKNMLLFLQQDSVRQLTEHLETVSNSLDYYDLWGMVQKLGIAILIGILIGLEREFSKPKDKRVFAGIRTFPLIAIMGFLAAMISSITDFGIYIIIIAGLMLLLAVSHYIAASKGNPGGTSETATILIFLLGSLVFWNYIVLAAIIAVIVAAFLSFKFQLHSFVGKINSEDIYATIKFAIITVIILPLLPNDTYGPYDVLNPRLIWLMVIFVSGISFIGYILIKAVGKDKGIMLTGSLGGLVSSTALTFSFAGKSKTNPGLSSSLAAGIIIASTVMYPRLLIIVAVLNRELALSLLIPLAIFTLVGLIIALYMIKNEKTKSAGEFETRNPFELKYALLFGLAFAVVIFISKAAEEYLGDAGIYLASALAGFTSIDAIAISLAKLAENGINAGIATGGIIIALITNTIFKIIVTFSAGAKEMRPYVLKGLGTIASVLIIYLILHLLVI